MSRVLTMSSILMLGAVVACHTPTDPAAAALSATLTAESTTLQDGDSTALTLVVRNLTSRSVTYDVGLGNWAFDVAIERATGGEVWRRSHQIHTAPSTQLTIPRRDNVSFRWVLRVGGPGGVTLPAGAYKVRGFFHDVYSDALVTANPVLDIVVAASP